MNIRRLLTLPTLCLGLLPALAAPAHAAQLQRVDLPVVPSGPVTGSALGGEGLFLGGQFASVGPFTGPGAQLDASTGALVGPSQRFDGDVNAVAADGVGGWYVGGAFRHAGGQPARGLVHLLADGTLDPRFDARLLPLPNNSGLSSVSALTLAGGRLYVAGAFSSIGGGSQSVLAAVDAATGTLISQFRPTFDAPATSQASEFVSAVAATSDRVYAGGGFTTGGRSNLAAFSADTGALMAGFDPDQGATATAPAPAPAPATPQRPGDTNGTVEALALTGNRLVVGGAFTIVGPSARNHLAALDASTGAVDGSFDPNADAQVDALLIDGTRLFVGGGFGFLNGRPHNHLAATSLATGIVDAAFTAEADGQVNALALSGSHLLVGGRYATLAGAVRTGLGAVDASTGAIDASFDPAPGRSVEALAAQQARLYAGGNFVTAGGAPRDRLALLDAGTGSLQGLSPQIRVRSLLGLLPGRILVADGRPEAKGVLRVRALDRQTGGLIDSFQPPDLPRHDTVVPAGNGFCVVADRDVRCYDPGSGLFRPVARTRGRGDRYLRALTIGSTLYVSGTFSRLNGKSRRNLGAVDLHTGRVRAFAPRLHKGDVTLLAGSRGRLYLSNRNRVLAVNRRTGRTVRRYPNGVCNIDNCGLSLAAGRLWISNPNVLRVLSAGTGELLARLNLPFPDVISTVDATRNRVYIGGSFADPDQSPFNSFRPFLTAFDLLG